MRVLIDQYHVSEEVARLALKQVLREYDPMGYDTEVHIIAPNLSSDFWRVWGTRSNSCD